jgi:hypothetical protein
MDGRVFPFQYLAGTMRALRAIPELPEVFQGVFQTTKILRAGEVSISLSLYWIRGHCLPLFRTAAIAFHNEL